jgi:DNA-binding transcriptional LysR family regulator
MLERLSLDFVTQQQQQQRSERDSVSIHIDGRVVKRDDDLMTVLTYVSTGYGVGVIAQTMTRINIPNVVYREIATSSVPKSAIAFVYRRNDSSPQTDLLIKHMRSHALRR